ncbi:hypothetical protein A2U01_0016498 [Trifolium medium]|uniref:Uncharacterized protein n=1 Tax=Trifolium medium TaxID=97028 RepID=A0A392N8L2_9FABA|nr:hypothetical protein [Trifolium medium]
MLSANFLAKLGAASDIMKIWEYSLDALKNISTGDALRTHVPKV